MGSTFRRVVEREDKDRIMNLALARRRREEWHRQIIEENILKGNIGQLKKNEEIRSA